MTPLSRLGLRAQLILAVALIVITGFSVTVGVLTHQAGTAQQTLALSYTQQLAHRNASDIKGRLQEALDAARTLARSLGALQVTGRADRELANAMLRGVLEGNAGFLGVWTGWEPNAFDGKDAEFVQQTGHDATGRFVPYWNRGGGRLQVEPLVGYDKPGDGDYYLLAKQRGKEVLLEPYAYEVGGKSMLITTVTVPIVLNGRFAGVAGIDIALDDLQRQVSAVSIMNTGTASLISNQGLYVGDRETARLGKPMDASDTSEQVRQAIAAGQELVWPTTDAALGAVTQVYVPVQLGETGTPWSFRAVAPESEMLRSVRRLQWTALGLALLSILVVTGVLAWALDRLVLKPIGGEPADASALAERVAQGDLTQTVRLRANDQQSLMARLQRMQEGLATVVTRVRQGANSVATASAEIAQGNHDLSSRTEQQASALEETAASMEELSGTVRQNDDNARQANQLAQDASRIAVEGGEVVKQVVHTMRDIQDSSGRIAQIIGVIDSIAFQTNILALNAAVEAARAGEQGRGFAVVASEVRNLAQRSAEAAKDIKQLIDASVSRVSAGTTLVDQAGNSMEAVVAAIRRVTDLMGEISAASSEQSTGVQQIGEAIAQMDQATQQNAALVEEMAAAASSLKGQADELVQAVSVFQLDAQRRLA